jgi:hypothetical protein
MSSKALYSTVLAGALVWVGMGMVGPTHAATINWTLDTGGTNTGTAYGNVRTFTSSGFTIQVEAFSTPTATGTTTTAYLGQYSSNGLGVSNRIETNNVPGDAPPNDHTVDNYGSFDMVVFQFPADTWDAISAFLTEFDIAPTGDVDSDVTYWVGTGNGLFPTLSSFDNKAIATIDANFTRTNVSHSGSNNVLFGSNGGADGATGRYLIVAASFTDTVGNDSFKIKTLAGNTPPGQQAPVPEPGSILLLGSGLAGLAIWGRRKYRKD